MANYIEIGKPAVLKEFSENNNELKYGEKKIMTYPAEQGSNGYVLTTDGDDNVSWKASQGGGGGSLDQSDVYIPIQEDIITYLMRWVLIKSYSAINPAIKNIPPAYKFENGEYIEITLENFGDITDYSHFKTYYTKATQFSSNGVPIMASGFIPGTISHTWDTSDPNDILATETITVVNPEDPSQSYDFNCMKILTTDISVNESLICTDSNSKSILGYDIFIGAPIVSMNYAQTVEALSDMPLDMLGFLSDDNETKFYLFSSGENMCLFLGFYASPRTANSLFGSTSKSGLYISTDILNMSGGGKFAGLTLVLNSGTPDASYKSPCGVIDFSYNRPYIIDVTRGQTSDNKSYFYISNPDYSIYLVNSLLRTGIPVMLSVDSKLLFDFDVFDDNDDDDYVDEDNGRILLTSTSGLNLTSSGRLKFTAVLSPKLGTTPSTYKSIGTHMTQEDYNVATRYSPLYVSNGSSYVVATEYVSGTEYFQKLKSTIDNTMLVLGAELDDDGELYFSVNYFDTRYTYPVNP